MKRLYEKIKWWAARHPDLMIAIGWLALGMVLLGVGAIGAATAPPPAACVCQ